MAAVALGFVAGLLARAVAEAGATVTGVAGPAVSSSSTLQSISTLGLGWRSCCWAVAGSAATSSDKAIVPASASSTRRGATDAIPDLRGAKRIVIANGDINLRGRI
ncbi:MAG: hypothetical protein HY057_03360 [Rhodospirillales bacterium]|nr:hypothetical protein [Rhodospirillales bacterium]